MPLSLSTATANAMLDVVKTRIDAGSAAGRIRIYSGATPVDADAALVAGNVLLADLACSDPSAPAAAFKALTLSSITQDSSADNTGVATFFRIVDSTNVVVLQGVVTNSGEGGDLQLNTTSITQGGPVQITSFVVNLP